MIKIEYKDVDSFVIDRSKWYRGKGGANSSLLLEDNSMCCLGFYASACGFTAEQIIHLGHPTDIEANWNTFLINKIPENNNDTSNSYACIELMSANDSISLKDEQREKRIIELFNMNGVKVEFVDGKEI